MRPWCLKIAPRRTGAARIPSGRGAFQAGISHSRQGWHPPHSFAGEPGTEQTGRSGAAIRINMDMTEVKQLNEALFRKRAPAYHPRLHRRSGAVHRYRHEHHLYEPGRREDERLVAKRSAGSAVLKVLHITFGENGPLMENIHSGDMSRTDIEQDVVLNCRNGGSFDIHYSITPSALWKVTPSARCW